MRDDLYQFSKWKPTPELRFAVPRHAPEMPTKLQQKWERCKFYQCIDVTQVVGTEDEWRDVETVFDDSPK